MARDNTVQYKGKTLQLFPGVGRSSYARTRVEVQERLDGRIVVKCGEEVLTPQEAPPLAAELRSHVTSPPVVPYVLDPIPSRPLVPKTPGPLAGETIWYEDPGRKQTHRGLVLAGMERARRSGKRIGRPSAAAESEDIQFKESDRVSDMPGFEENLKGVAELIEEGTLSRRKASIKLGIGYATLKRMLDARAASGS